MRLSVEELLAGGPTVSLGILTADLLQLGGQLALLEQAGGRIVHIDSMDGVFCPQFTVGPPFVAALPDSFVKDCHLMIQEPLGQLPAYLAAGAGIITFHVEATKHPHRVLQALAGTGVIRGVALNPGTPLTMVESLIDDLELILVLAINPGWGGQHFLPGTPARLAEAHRLIGGRPIILGVDGGITKTNIDSVAGMGPDLVVSGSAVFDGVAPMENARSMLAAVRRPSR
jgi:ribulose-phosphate 3-epimerase